MNLILESDGIALEDILRDQLLAAMGASNNSNNAPTNNNSDNRTSSNNTKANTNKNGMKREQEKASPPIEIGFGAPMSSMPFLFYGGKSGGKQIAETDVQEVDTSPIYVDSDIG